MPEITWCGECGVRNGYVEELEDTLARVKILADALPDVGEYSVKHQINKALQG